MSDYRDNSNPKEPHVVFFGRVELVFGPGGLLTDATPAQEAAMTADDARRSRFIVVEALAKGDVQGREPVAGSAMAADLVAGAKKP